MTLIMTPVRATVTATTDVCQRPAAGSALPAVPELRSSNGVLRVRLRIIAVPDADNSVRYCYLTPDGSIAPTLRLHPGDLLVLQLVNALTAAAATPGMHMQAKSQHSCSGAMLEMGSASTNLHFHGLTVPALCHQDDVLHTVIQPGDAPFEYRLHIPADEPPGLYWYHPHIHGFSSAEVSGGASGAIIIEGIERAAPQLAGLPERLFIIRDQPLLHPDAPPSKSEPVVPRSFIDRDGDTANNGTGFGRPARDLSVNFVPVPYPDYPTATLRMQPGRRELWRVLNASAITYLNLALLFDRVPQPLTVVGIDGMPVGSAGSPGPAEIRTDHIGLPPGARAEFVIESPAAGSSGLLVTRSVDTGQGGENDPNRALVALRADATAPAPRASLPRHPQPLPPPARPWLGSVQPARVRHLYFSEKLDNPSDPNSANQFYLTEEGHTPAVYDPASTQPDIVVRQGDVEDWIIENRSTELHAFHIHQLHFELLDWSGVPVNEPFLRDTVNVPYFSGHSLQYPSVRIRLDFRDPNTVGTFLYHCHVLEHEDGGMMGTIQVLPRDAASVETPTAAR